MLYCMYDKISLENELFTYKYDGELGSLSIIINKAKENNLKGVYSISNYKEFEEVINVLINYWLEAEKVLTKDHIEFLTKIKDTLDFQRFAECNFDIIEYMEREAQEKQL